MMIKKRKIGNFFVSSHFVVTPIFLEHEVFLTPNFRSLDTVFKGSVKNTDLNHSQQGLLEIIFSKIDFTFQKVSISKSVFKKRTQRIKVKFLKL